MLFCLEVLLFLVLDEVFGRSVLFCFEFWCGFGFCLLIWMVLFGGIDFFEFDLRSILSLDIILVVLIF